MSQKKYEQKSKRKSEGLAVPKLNSVLNQVQQIEKLRRSVPTPLNVAESKITSKVASKVNINKNCKAFKNLCTLNADLVIYPRKIRINTQRADPAKPQHLQQSLDSLSLLIMEPTITCEFPPFRSDYYKDYLQLEADD